MVRFGRNRGGAAGGTSRTSNVGAGKIMSAFSVLLIPIWIFAGGAWIVQVVGLGLCEHQQQNGRHFLQFDWFVTAFEVFVLLLLPFPLIARRASPGITALLAVVTVLEILRTNVWNDARLAQGGINGGSTQIDSVINPGLNSSSKRVNTVFAGYLITSIFNLALLLGLGSLPAPSAQDARQLEHGTRNAADQHNADKYGANNGVTHNNGVAHTGTGTGGVGTGGVGGPMRNGVDTV